MSTPTISPTQLALNAKMQIVKYVPEQVRVYVKDVKTPITLTVEIVRPVETMLIFAIQIPQLLLSAVRLDISY